MRIGSFFGVDIKIHLLFFAALIASILLGMFEYLAMVFLIILLHETGHVIAARLLHLRVFYVEVLPFGCTARIESSCAQRPLAEAAVAICGPMVNALLALVAAFFQYYVQVGIDFTLFISINLMIGGFNMLPAFPMDGGRILRGLLTNKLGMQKSTRIVLFTTWVIALFCLAAGVYYLLFGVVYPNAFAICILLVFGALRCRKEALFNRMKSTSRHAAQLYRGQVMRVHHVAVSSATSLEEIINRMIPGKFNIVTIMGADKRLGTLDEQEILDAVLAYGTRAKVIQALK
ncbi:MAG: M50 family metallopeptidase [Christensenellales bacterium]|jgi:stage IV sporulation protein FB